MVTLASTVINRAVKGFRSRTNPDILQTALDNSSTQVNYRGILQGWGPGTLIEIDAEVMLVVEADTNNKVATVVRGWLDTTAAAHAVNKPIFINPRIYRSDVLDLFNDALEDMYGGGLFKVGVQEKIYDPGAIGYEIPADAVTILRVDGLKDGPAGYWQPIYDWLEVDNTDVADFTSGRAIMLRTALPPGAFRVVYGGPFTRLTDESQDLEAFSGLRPYMTDLPFYYAMSRLMVDLERHRSQVESAQSHQRAQDSPPFLALRTGEWYQARYNDRLRNCIQHQMRETKTVRGTGYGS